MPVVQGVVRSPVVEKACCGERDPVPGVVPMKARYAGVIPYRGGRRMRVVPQATATSGRTRRSS